MKEAEEILRLSKLGWSSRKITKKLHIHERKITRARREAGFVKKPGVGVHWSLPIREEVLRMIDAGVPARRIASKMGVSAECVNLRKNKKLYDEIREHNLSLGAS